MLQLTTYITLCTILHTTSLSLSLSSSVYLIHRMDGRISLIADTHHTFPCYVYYNPLLALYRRSLYIPEFLCNILPYTLSFFSFT
ncbi:hypothetical protein C8J57DRAFT_77965 [Mycena rebaudengoi]|nr:hypothetical protein C8J57DRAFT_77965 [Mycena rebaudengoi]